MMIDDDDDDDDDDDFFFPTQKKCPTTLTTRILAPRRLPATSFTSTRGTTEANPSTTTSRRPFAPRKTSVSVVFVFLRARNHLLI